MGKEMIFLYKAIFFGLAAIIIIPRESFKKYFVYGLFWGAMADILIIGLFSGLLHGSQYKNMGPFNILNLFSFWTPIAWMFVIMVFLYCLPTRKMYVYIYTPTFGLFGYMVGLVLQNFGLFELRGIYKLITPFVLISWFAVAAWAYLKAEKIKLQ